jgi:hypothetical protein
VIDAAAQSIVERDIAAMGGLEHRVLRPARVDADALGRGTFVPPTLIEIDRLATLQCAVFGPLLPLLRYQREGLSDLLKPIAQIGCGPTMLPGRAVEAAGDASAPPLRGWGRQGPSRRRQQGVRCVAVLGPRTRPRGPGAGLRAPCRCGAVARLAAVARARRRSEPACRAAARRLAVPGGQRW